ncbi:MAG TPA: helix-turn-helix transcriptional regulator, partial [Acidimicrobiales bacterium]|nr:helix-turn-helix transcriptional regulator [Acidimicrobiales bacterium]
HGELLLESFGERVAERRIELGPTQVELAARCDLDRTYISGLENGRRNPTLVVLTRLAVGLDWKPDQLFSS